MMFIAELTGLVLLFWTLIAFALAAVWVLFVEYLRWRYRHRPVVTGRYWNHL